MGAGKGFPGSRKRHHEGPQLKGTWLWPRSTKEVYKWRALGALPDPRGHRCGRGRSRKASIGFRLEGNSGAKRRARWRMERDSADTEACQMENHHSCAAPSLCLVFLPVSGSYGLSNFPPEFQVIGLVTFLLGPLPRYRCPGGVGK